MSFDYQKLGALAHNTTCCGSTRRVAAVGAASFRETAPQGGIAPLTYKVSESGERIIDERPRCPEQHRCGDQNDRMYTAQLDGEYNRRPQQ